MPRDSRLLLAVAVAAVVVTAGCSIPFLSPDPESFGATYDYSFGLDAYGSLSNVTLLVPLPVGPDGMPMNATILVPDGVVYESSFDDEPGPAFDARIVETEFGPMLELTADEFAVETRYYAFVEEDGLGERVEISADEYDPDDPDHLKVDFRSASVMVTVDAEYPLDTRNPVGNEPVLPATGERAVATCPPMTDAEAVCYEYDAPVFLSYDAAEDARLQLVVSFTGSNEWFAGGWNGNDYRDHVAVNVTGGQDGWTTGEGTLVTGSGNYLD